MEVWLLEEVAEERLSCFLANLGLNCDFLGAALGLGFDSMFLDRTDRLFFCFFCYV